MTRRNAQTSPVTEATSVRPRRIGVAMRPKLALFGKDPNYEYRWVNDTPGRVAMFKHTGWEVCSNDEVDTGSFRVEDATELGSLAYAIVDGGSGLKAYVMKIKKEYFDDFLEQMAEEVDATEEALQPNSNDGAYGEVRIDRSGRNK